MRRSALSAAAALSLLAACKSTPALHDEEHRRETSMLELRAREGLQAPLKIASSRDVRFEWGFSGIEYDPKDDYRSPRAFRWAGQRGALRVQRHGDKPMKLTIVGWVNARVLRTKPTVSAYLDGQYLSSMVVEEINDEGFGGFQVGGTVQPDMFQHRDWAMVDLDLSSVAFHWSDPPTLKVAMVSSVEWQEAD